MKRKIIPLFLFFVSFFFVLSMTVNASSYLSDKGEINYNSTNGLVTGKANTICQTDDGYIWIGQYAGLTRYDSKNFKTINNYADFDLTSIVALAAKGNKLLIGGEKGFFIKDESGDIKKIDTNDDNLVVKDIKVVDNYAIVGTTSGLLKYNIDTEKVERINNRSISRITIKDIDDYYYIEGKDKLYFCKQENPIFTGNIKSIHYMNNKMYIGDRSGHIYIFDVNNLGNIIDKEGNVFDLNIRNYNTVFQLEDSDSTINDILVNEGKIYICSDDGLYVGDANDSSTVNKVKNYGDKFNKMEKSYFDYEGNLWVTSSSQGVFKITQNRTIDYFFENNINDVTTYALERYHGLTFIGTDDGVIVIDDNGKVIEKTDDFTGLSNLEIEINKLYDSIGTNTVRDIEVYDDKIYFATYNTNGNLFYFDINKVSINDSIDSLKYDDLSQNKYLTEEAKDYRCLRAVGDYLFVGLDKGVARYDGSTYKYIETKVYPLYMTYKDNDLYIVLNTIGVVSTSVNNFSSFTLIDPNHNYSTLKCLYVNDGLLFTDNNNLYFSKDGNINKINIDMLGSIVDLMYINGKYFVCSEASVHIYDDLFTSNPTYKRLDNTNGLKASLVANSSGYYDEDEENYYFVTSTGVLVFDVNTDLTDRSIARKIALDSIFVDDEKMTGDNFKLSSDIEKIEINFSVLSYVSDQHYKIYYKLNGYDKDYQELSPSDSYTITYKNIEGGDYSFELYVMDANGKKSETTLTFSFNKKKSITEYETFWILLALLILIIVVALIVIWYRVKIKKSIERQNEYKKITLESIETITRTIDAKDTYTNGHSKRVGIYSREIARALNMSDEEIENIYYVALLHDIGKIAIPISILNKPGRLTDEEFEIMKTHTTAGAKILEGISTIPNIIDGAKYHHERYGGGGYPSGIKGEEIPFIARIICCADCYDAMATRRTYKEPYPKEKIISEFERCKETQFDPKIADVVIRLIKEDRLRAGTEERKIEDNNEKPIE